MERRGSRASSRLSRHDASAGNHRLVERRRGVCFRLGSRAGRLAQRRAAGSLPVRSGAGRAARFGNPARRFLAGVGFGSGNAPASARPGRSDGGSASRRQQKLEALRDRGKARRDVFRGNSHRRRGASRRIRPGSLLHARPRWQRLRRVGLLTGRLRSFREAPHGVSRSHRRGAGAVRLAGRQVFSIGGARPNHSGLAAGKAGADGEAASEPGHRRARPVGDLDGARLLRGVARRREPDRLARQRRSRQ